jgi:hypothetical protein
MAKFNQTTRLGARLATCGAAGSAPFSGGHAHAAPISAAPAHGFPGDRCEQYEAGQR